MSAGRTALGFIGLALAVSLALALIGYWPTARWGGENAVPALLAACAVGLVSALACAPLIAAAGSGPAQRRATLALSATAVRAVAALGLGAAAVKAGFEKEPLLIWLVVSYLALLALETVYMLKALTSERN